MRLREAFEQVIKIRIPPDGSPVEKTVADECRQEFCPRADVQAAPSGDPGLEHGVLSVAVMDRTEVQRISGKKMDIPVEKEWVYFSMDQGFNGVLASSRPCFLYAAFSYITDNLLDADVSEYNPWFRCLSFSVEKSTFDLFLTQYARLIRRFQPEVSIRENARMGFSHIEVNALAFPQPVEEGVKGEFYSDFYTYCPALDQFVSSRLNQGIYDEDYLKANLMHLKKNALLAVRFGLAPGLLCFEPRSVPEAVFQRYPTIRGARVDHPFRSLKPRYSLSLAHPLTQRHYAEMLTKLLEEVPELEYLTIWTNDSGAGFEHTKSLYAGRNGGAYLIREWKSDEKISRAATKNIIDFFKLLRSTACRINPRFRVITRLESFYGEREFLWPGLKDRIDVEANTLLSRGWESPYVHPRYKDIPVLGSALHNRVSEKEKNPLQELESRKSLCYFYHFFGPHGNHEPLLGIPFPWLVHEKILSLSRAGIQALAHVGGIPPPDKVPYAVNHEVFRNFQFDKDLNIDDTIFDIAVQYAGPEYAEALVQGWRNIDLSVRSFVPLSIYTHYGVVWQRLFVRPLVPDIDSIPEEDRAYYERLMCTSVHNPNKIDLSKDVLFELIPRDYARKAVELIDGNVWDPLETALRLFKQNWIKAKKSGNAAASLVFEDQSYRCRALRCLFLTLRNTAVWVYAVREYLETSNPEIKNRCREKLDEMMDSEIQNCRDLLALWEESPAEWMIVSGEGETPFIYGDNFPELLEKKIKLMEGYRHLEPRVDPDYMFRVKNDPYA
ncbi:MAG: hypothetical protein PVF22_07830 [Candidatus Aminicenantes bacterium]